MDDDDVQALKFREPGLVRSTYLGLLVESVSPHELELRHPNHSHPVLSLEFPHEDASPQGVLRSGGYRQRIRSVRQVDGKWQGIVDEDDRYGDEEDFTTWSCEWDTWIHEWCRALMESPPRMAKPGLPVGSTGASIMNFPLE